MKSHPLLILLILHKVDCRHEAAAAADSWNVVVAVADVDPEFHTEMARVGWHTPRTDCHRTSCCGVELPHLLHRGCGCGFHRLRMPADTREVVEHYLSDTVQYLQG